MSLRSLVVFAVIAAVSPFPSAAATVDDDIAVVKSVGPLGEGHEAATKALGRLSSGTDLLTILDGMSGANPLARNWLRGAAESAVRNIDQGDKSLPTGKLKAFLRDSTNDPHARSFAYELLASRENGFAESQKNSFLSDPSLELRRISVGELLDRAKAASDANKERAVGIYQEAITAARDIDQIESAAKALKELEAEVDVNDVMGFITQWHLAAPFDNTDKSGFDVAYAPEKDVDLKATYDGKEQKVNWVSHSTDEEYGVVDINAAIAKHKGAICYAYAEFESTTARDIQIRLGCINANKVWLNGELLTANQVYHANIFVDQYVADGKVRAGKNSILVKVAQNEQEESWAQRWQFQLRVCDALGGGIPSADAN